MLKLVLTLALLVAAAAAAPSEPAPSQKTVSETSLPSGGVTSETTSESSKLKDTANSSIQLSTPEETPAPSAPGTTEPGSTSITDMGRNLIKAPRINHTCPPGFAWAGWDRGCSRVYT